MPEASFVFRQGCWFYCEEDSGLKGWECSAADKGMVYAFVMI